VGSFDSSLLLGKFGFFSSFFSSLRFGFCSRSCFGFCLCLFSFQVTDVVNCLAVEIDAC
jgi:hypothetical protein